MVHFRLISATLGWSPGPTIAPCSWASCTAASTSSLSSSLDSVTHFNPAIRSLMRATTLSSTLSCTHNTQWTWEERKQRGGQCGYVEGLKNGPSYISSFDCIAHLGFCLESGFYHSIHSTVNVCCIKDNESTRRSDTNRHWYRYPQPCCGFTQLGAILRDAGKILL